MDIRENAVKVYRDTALAWFCVIFLVSMLALVIYLVFTSDLSTWGYVVFGVAFIATVSYFFDIRKNRNTIVVYPESLQIEHAQRMKNDFEGDDVGIPDSKFIIVIKLNCKMGRATALPSLNRPSFFETAVEEIS